MKADEEKNTEFKKETVILMLPGFDKKWVFKKGEGWVEYIEPSTIMIKEIQEQNNEKLDSVDELIIKSKKWWQFWK
jgi:predicted butyrate kinase (DUF1464 family)